MSSMGDQPGGGRPPAVHAGARLDQVSMEVINQ